MAVAETIKNYARKKLQSFLDSDAVPAKQIASEGLEPLAYSSYYYVNPIYSMPFDGEKTPGEMGAPIDYHLQYQWLRIRSWQSFLDSEVTQSIINKFGVWVISNGLKLQSEPNIGVLKSKGITVDLEEFTNTTESLYKVITGEHVVDYKNMQDWGSIQFEIHKNAVVGGDVLQVQRVEDGIVKVQVIDGAHVGNPIEGAGLAMANKLGNEIRHGVELDKVTGEHVAYHVRQKDASYARIPRYGEKSGRLMAFLVYGSKYRLDDVRGIPLITAVLETLKKLDRYKEATVGSAEERQKIAYSVEHKVNSTGENPLLAKLQQSRDLGTGEAPETKTTDSYEAAATKIATTTNKQVFNLPIDASLNLLESKNELYFKEFYDTNVAAICAAVGIPFEVARSMYDSNYSASRAAIKDWEHMLFFHRVNFSKQSNQPYYNLFLDINILRGLIVAPGYIDAIRNNDIIVIAAYRVARFTGANVPNIDPVKEVNAERIKLGDFSTPLTTYEDASERLGTGNWSQLIERNKAERAKIPEEMKKEKSTEQNT